MDAIKLDKANKLSGSGSPPLDEIRNYKIARMLGRGATSNAYLGIDKATSRLVAIKKIRPECTIGVQHMPEQLGAIKIGALQEFLVWIHQELHD